MVSDLDLLRSAMRNGKLALSVRCLCCRHKGLLYQPGNARWQGYEVWCAILALT
jgi:hypothetical protein